MSLAGAGIGVALGVIDFYTYAVLLLPGGIKGVPGYSTAALAMTDGRLALSLAVTPLVFYLIGKGSPLGLRRGAALLGVYFGAFLGQVAGSAILMAFVYSLPLSDLGFIAPLSLSSSLSVLFVAISGYALSNLSRTTPGSPASKLWYRLPLLAALGIAAIEGLSASMFTLYPTGAGPFLLGAIDIIAVFVLLPLQFLVFYYVGKRVSVEGRTFKSFGVLFAGMYAGTVVGTLAAVALFGSGDWTSTAGASLFSNGVPFQNVSVSLGVILNSLNPVGALPFLAFFGMSLTALSRSEAGFEAPPVSPSSGTGPAEQPEDHSRPQAAAGTLWWRRP